MALFVCVLLSLSITASSRLFFPGIHVKFEQHYNEPTSMRVLSCTSTQSTKVWSNISIIYFLLFTA